MDPSAVVMLISNGLLKEVFKTVAKNRSVLFKELYQALGKDLGKTKVEEAVRQLKDADLIKERVAPIEDFNTYYVTADGLTVEKQLRLAEARVSADRA